MGAAVRQATIELLEEVGYDALQLPAVAARAGVDKTTVYRRWQTKARLISDVMGDVGDDDVPVPDTGSLHQDLTELLTAIVRALDRPATRIILQAHIAASAADEELERARRRFWGAQFSEAAAIVERAMARSEIDPGAEPRQVLDLVSGPAYLRRLVTNEPVDAPSGRR